MLKFKIIQTIIDNRVEGSNKISKGVFNNAEIALQKMFADVDKNKDPKLYLENIEMFDKTVKHLETNLNQKELEKYNSEFKNKKIFKNSHMCNPLIILDYKNPKSFYIKYKDYDDDYYFDY